MTALGTDGFGRSESRADLRRHFEVDARHIAYATIVSLAQQGALEIKVAEQAAKDLDINPEKADPAVS